MMTTESWTYNDTGAVSWMLYLAGGFLIADGNLDALPFVDVIHLLMMSSHTK